ncbi:hypothetical protein, partial [Chryseobacterium sp. RR2-3-20]|uniref:hypothetical protein n=1 Tax=Chryseobacterium sp. RR2-3-20 TaxID=2787626 RepID=UPI001AE00458
VWSSLRDIIYKERIESRGELLQKIQEAANVIRNNAGLIFNIRISLIKRLEKCIEVGGAHFEQLL